MKITKTLGAIVLSSAAMLGALAGSRSGKYETTLNVDGTIYKVRQGENYISVREPDPIVQRAWYDHGADGELDKLGFVGGTVRGGINFLIEKEHPLFGEAAEYYKNQIFPRIRQ